MRFISNGKILTCVALICFSLLVWKFFLSAAPLSEQIRGAYKSGEFTKVRLLAADLDEQQLADFDTCWYVGCACESLHDYPKAVAYLGKAMEAARESARKIRVALKIAEIHGKSDNDHLSIDLFSELIEQYPQDARLRRRAATLLDEVGRRYEANRHHLALVVMGQNSIDDLIVLADRHEAVVGPKVEAALRDPNSEKYRTLRALIAWRSGRLSEAESLLRAEIASDSSLLEAHALLGLVLLDIGDTSQLSVWHAALPDPGMDHPDVWYVRGVWAEALKQPQVAVTCFRNALRLDPCFGQAIFRLAVAGGNELTDSVSDQLTDRVEVLKHYRQVCKSVFFNGPDVQSLKTVIDLAEALELFDEAAGWAQILNARSGFPLVDLERISRLKSNAKAVSAAGQVRGLGILSSLPISETEISDWPKPGGSTAVVSLEQPAISFADEASRFGMDFQYMNGAKDPNGWMIRQSMGGGVGVLDYDGDSWPDIFLPQGESAMGVVSDALFRNVRGISTQRVESIANCGGVEFSHGAAVGDIDNDGFPDIYVANSGTNQLYVNNGDGTFRAAETVLQSKKWTVSAVVADLNGDSWPDLFDVNYLEWGRPFVEPCIDSELGLPRTCPPERFAGESDELYVNTADGGFSNDSAEVGISIALVTGLGVVAGDFSGDGNISVFVANDQVPNFFWQADSRQQNRLQLREVASAFGLAVNGSGESLACMGVAAADVNHDGGLDLFVTNFYRQPNTLYLNIGASNFHDATRQAGLFEPGLLKLGFGTQFLDANLDGEQDLVVVNGHLDDFTGKGIPFAMQPHLFVGRGNASFQEQAANVTGAYFESVHIARGLATLDFDRNGLTDLAVSQIGETASLLINHTQEPGHFLLVRLVGKLSSRDAFGAIVSCSSGKQTCWKHLTAGDGYASSNQKDVIIGLNENTTAQTLQIQWPSGGTQLFTDVQADRKYVVLEAVDRLFEVSE
ncbi:MAG: FG-GAP-like repeat-containing protein [Fuerstiella sp.]